MPYRFEEKVYENWDKLNRAVMRSHPELLDDSLIDFIDAEVEEFEYTKCWICGAPLGGFVVPFLREKGVCSNYCLEDAGWDYS